MISVLIPTRRRVEDLKRSLEVLAETCHDINDVEVLLRVDEDDPDTIYFLEQVKYFPNMKCVIGPRKRGYNSLHEFLYELYLISSGEILLPYNDDSVMLTKNWDVFIKNMNDRYWVIRLFSQDTTKDGLLYFAASRKLIDALGHFGKSVHVDAWISCVCRGYIEDSKIHIIHKHKHINLKKIDNFYTLRLTYLRAKDRKRFLKAKTGIWWPVWFLFLSELAEKIRILRYMKRKLHKMVRK